MSEILVGIFVPAIQTEYDVFIPANSTISDILELTGKAISDQSDGRFVPDETTVICRRADGTILDINRSVYESGIRNGSKLMLI